MDTVPAASKLPDLAKRSDNMAELGMHQSALLTDLALCINRYRLFSPGWSVCVMAKVQLSAAQFGA